MMGEVDGKLDVGRPSPGGKACSSVPWFRAGPVQCCKVVTADPHCSGSAGLLLCPCLLPPCTQAHVAKRPSTHRHM